MMSEAAASAAADLDVWFMLRVREGDACGFEWLLARHREPVVHFFYRMVQDPEAAAELAQEVFLRVYRSRARYQPSARFTNWLYRIATNLALNYLRRQKRTLSLDEVRDNGLRLPCPERRPNVEEELLRQARIGAVRKAVAALPPRQRAVIVLHQYHGLDYQQIAQALGCSVSAVKSLTFRAYAHLRRQLSAL